MGELFVQIQDFQQSSSAFLILQNLAETEKTGMLMQKRLFLWSFAITF